MDFSFQKKLCKTVHYYVQYKEKHSRFDGAVRVVEIHQSCRLAMQITRLLWRSYRLLTYKIIGLIEFHYRKDLMISGLFNRTRNTERQRFWFSQRWCGAKWKYCAIVIYIVTYLVLPKYIRAEKINADLKRVARQNVPLKIYSV